MTLLCTLGFQEMVHALFFPVSQRLIREGVASLFLYVVYKLTLRALLSLINLPPTRRNLLHDVDLFKVFLKNPKLESIRG